MNKKIIIHKIKWQKITLEGWSIRFHSSTKSICSNLNVEPLFKIRYNNKDHWHGNGSKNWKKVNCKKCLKSK